MKRTKTIPSISYLFFILCLVPSMVQSQQSLWFGSIKVDGKLHQARYEADSSLQKIIFAPYGRTPISFTNVKTTGQHMTFNWQYNKRSYHCSLSRGTANEYKGACLSSTGGQQIEMIMREFTPEDANLQGNSLKWSMTDLQIVDRALALLNNGSNWSRSDNRVCDSSSYPYQWSLFCALHQASIDVDKEYRHLRPAMHAARQAIEEATRGKKFAHLLQDFNKDAQHFSAIAGVLNRAKEIIAGNMNSDPGGR